MSYEKSNPADRQPWDFPTDRSLNMNEKVDLWASCARVSPLLRSQTEDKMIKAIVDNYNDIIKSLIL